MKIGHRLSLSICIRMRSAIHLRQDALKRIWIQCLYKVSWGTQIILRRYPIRISWIRSNKEKLKKLGISWRAEKLV